MPSRFVATGRSLLGGSGASLAAPVLAMAGSWTSADNTPDFSATLSPLIVAGDAFRLQIQVAGSDWNTPLSDTTHTVTSGEASGHSVALAGLALGDGNYEVRANQTHIVTSSWSIGPGPSGGLPFTVAATTFVPTFELLGF